MIRTLTIAAAAIAASACNVGANAEERDPGSQTSRTYQVGAFDRIEVSGPYDVKVATGGSPGASATGGDKLLDETEVVVEGNVLKIRAKKKNGIRWSWGRKGKAEFTVTTAMLREAGIAGSGAIAIDKVEGDFSGAWPDRETWRWPRSMAGRSALRLPDRARSAPPARRNRPRSRLPVRATSTPQPSPPERPTCPSPARATSRPMPATPPSVDCRIGQRQHRRRRQMQHRQGRWRQCHLRVRIGG